MLNQSCRRLLDRSGQSIVEIGLVTPFLLIALYVPIDFGIAYYTAQLTQNAVREAARIAASTDPFDPGVAATIAENSVSIDENIPYRVPKSLHPVTVTVTFFGGSNCMQNVMVSAQGSYNYFFYQLLRLVGITVSNTNPASISITRSSRMRYDFQPYTFSNACSTQSFAPQSTRA